MPLRIYALLTAASFMAAVGQLLFKVGATGRTSLAAFVNPHIAGGLLLYGLSTLVWIFSLSQAKLTVVYPFTVLTFVLVYAFGILMLGETISAKALVGIGLVLVGLYCVTTS